jgi:hypothetical protein
MTPQGPTQSATCMPKGFAPAVVELLIDAEEEPALRALLVGLLREVT